MTENFEDLYLGVDAGSAADKWAAIYPELLRQLKDAEEVIDAGRESLSHLRRCGFAAGELGQLIDNFDNKAREYFERHKK